MDLPRRRLAGLLAAASLPRLIRPAAASPTGALARILASGELRVGVWLGAPPWGMRNDLGAPDGSEVVLAQLLAHDLGVRLRLLRLDAAGRLPALLEDRVDVLAAVLQITPQTLLRVAFAASHGEVAAVVVTRRGAPIRRFADLAGQAIALPADSFLGESVFSALPADSPVLFLPEMEDCISALLDGEVAAVAMLDSQLRSLLLDRPSLGIGEAFAVATWHHALAARLGEPDLLRFLNTFLALRWLDGSIPDIQQHYLGQAGTRPLVYR
jgi:polar amino acid transport system substrate-binding protein